jgi:hypothetical protein
MEQLQRVTPDAGVFFIDYFDLSSTGDGEQLTFQQNDRGCQGYRRSSIFLIVIERMQSGDRGETLMSEKYLSPNSLATVPFSPTP